MPDIEARSHEIDQRGTEQRKHGGDRECKAEAPQHDETRRGRETVLVARAIGAAAELLGGVGEPVEKEGVDQEEIVQHRVGGKRHIAGAGALRGEKQECRNQCGGSDHDVAIDGEHPHQLGAVEQRRTRHCQSSMRQAPGDQNTDHEARGLGEDGGNRCAGNAEVQHQHQHDRRGHVDDVDRNLHAECQGGTCLPDQPAEHDVICQRQRRRPDPDDEIGLRRARHAFAAAHRTEQDRCERNLQGDERRADQRRDDEAAHQDRPDFLALA